jgi:hypothetical protein
LSLVPSTVLVFAFKKGLFFVIEEIYSMLWMIKSNKRKLNRLLAETRLHKCVKLIKTYDNYRYDFLTFNGWCGK